MRIAVNLLGLPSLRQGGAGFIAATLIRGLAGSPGVDVRVLCSPAVADELADSGDAVDLRPVRQLDGSRASNVLGLARSLRDPRAFGQAGVDPQLLAGCDVVHYPLSSMAPPRHALPTVVTALDLQHLEFPSHFRRRDRLLRTIRWHGSLRRATRVVAISHYTSHAIVQRLGIDPRRIDVVYAACNERFLSRAPVASVGLERFLLYPASPLPGKNHPRLIAAFARAARNDPSVRLALSGPMLHDWSPVIEAVRRHAVADRVSLLGHLSLEELRAHYVHAEALLFPSLCEGLGLPVVEAMGCGCPVGAARAGSLPEILDGAAATLFDPRSEDAIHDAIVRCLSLSPTERAALSASGRKRARTFNVEGMVAGVLDSYERATRSHVLDAG